MDAGSEDFVTNRIYIWPDSWILGHSWGSTLEILWQLCLNWKRGPIAPLFVYSDIKFMQTVSAFLGVDMKRFL